MRTRLTRKKLRRPLRQGYLWSTIECMLGLDTTELREAIRALFPGKR